ncbi:F0F1 ATP synthase subunit delta [Candidatus Saccharibacteria bacterium]|nr:F0F1 ATP synthase subunit delta [Candidatus Saccharibacteria bacterium]MBI2285723.1 F0F1 ATP synthase subunit delta [Candidatus Saccharibacteria bacterium]
MISFSRRRLAKYAVDELSKNRPLRVLSARLAAALAASGRRKEIDLLLSDISQEMEERGLLAITRLTSASPLSEKLKHEVTLQLKKMVGVKEVILQEEIDKNLIGGLKAETASRAWDRTLKRELSKIREIA